jgi:hypothetical protein
VIFKSLIVALSLMTEESYAEGTIHNRKWRLLNFILGGELERFERNAYKHVRQHYFGEILKLRKSLEEKDAEISELEKRADNDSLTIARLKEQLQEENVRTPVVKPYESLSAGEKSVIQSTLRIYIKWSHYIYRRRYRQNPPVDELFNYTLLTLHMTRERILSETDSETLRSLYDETLEYMSKHGEARIEIENER